MTTDELIEQASRLEGQERIDFVMKHRPEFFSPAPRVVSFGKAPKDGWKESDRVQKCKWCGGAKYAPRHDLSSASTASAKHHFEEATR